MTISNCLIKLLTVSYCVRYSGWLLSTTCTNKSAPLASSKVDLKAAINVVGSFCIKPTVSE